MARLEPLVAEHQALMNWIKANRFDSPEAALAAGAVPPMPLQFVTLDLMVVARKEVKDRRHKRFSQILNDLAMIELSATIYDQIVNMADEK
jgi:hypothetical protein